MSIYYSIGKETYSIYIYKVLKQVKIHCFFFSKSSGSCMPSSEGKRDILCEKKENSWLMSSQRGTRSFREEQPGKRFAVVSGSRGQSAPTQGAEPLLLSSRRGKCPDDLILMPSHLGSLEIVRPVVSLVQKRENERTSSATCSSLSPSGCAKLNVNFTGVQGSKDQTTRNKGWGVFTSQLRGE